MSPCGALLTVASLVVVWVVGWGSILDFGLRGACETTYVWEGYRRVEVPFRAADYRLMQFQDGDAAAGRGKRREGVGNRGRSSILRRCPSVHGDGADCGGLGTRPPAPRSSELHTHPALLACVLLWTAQTGHLRAQRSRFCLCTVTWARTSR